jgi:hypothetical protein
MDTESILLKLPFWGLFFGKDATAFSTDTFKSSHAGAFEFFKEGIISNSPYSVRKGVLHEEIKII